jgi:hypothetical protein
MLQQWENPSVKSIFPRKAHIKNLGKSKKNGGKKLTYEYKY